MMQAAMLKFKSVTREIGNSYWPKLRCLDCRLYCSNNCNYHSLSTITQSRKPVVFITVVNYCHINKIKIYIY